MNVIQAIKNRTKSHYILYIVAILGIFLMFFSNSATASENITTDVSIEPSLTVTIPSTPLVLNLDPSSTDSGSNNLTITVGTNNATGYKTIITSQSGDTDLVETTDNTLTIPTLASGSYSSPSDFPANHWGYKKDSGSYIPFATNTTILESDTYANDDTTTLSFASKIDYLQASGTYKTTLVFTTTANPLIKYMQTFTASDCSAMNIEDIVELPDIRDDEVYKVARLADGNCWMLDNMRLDLTDSDVQASLSPSNTNSTAEALECLINGGCSSPYATSAVNNTWSEQYTEPRIRTGYKNVLSSANYGAGSGLIGVFYNYCAASAGSYCYPSGAAVDTPDTYLDSPYDICPIGWRIPTLANNASTEYYHLYASYSNSGPTFQQKLSLGNYAYADSPTGTGAYIFSSTRSSHAQQEVTILDTRGINFTNFSNYLYRSKGTVIRCFLEV